MAENGVDPQRRSPRLLAHPAFLLVLTAVLTGLLVPWIASRWEERDKRVETRRLEAERELDARRAAEARELEVKSAIVSRIGTASARFLSAMEVRVIDADGPGSEAEYRALRDASLEIASQLAAYFPDSRPVVRWRDYTFSLRNAYLLLQQQPGRARDHWLDELNRYLDVGPQQFDGLCFPGTNAVFVTDLRQLVVALQNKEEDIVRTVAGSKTVLTGTPTRDVNVKRVHYDPKQKKPCTAVLGRQGGA